MSEYFNEKAVDWDANDMVRGLSSAIGAEIGRRVPLNEEMDVMDFGAGTGLISTGVAPLVRRIVAVDTSEGMLDKLAAKPQLRGKVEPLCRNILEQPFDGQFDLIMSAMAMHHVENTDQLIQTFARHLKAGGMVALADLDREDGTFHPDEAAGVFHHGFDRGELQATLQRHGFRDVQFSTAHTVVKEEKGYPVFLVTARYIDAATDTCD